jgi:trehalose-phosphatase
MLPSIVPDFPAQKPYLGLMLDYDGTLAPIVMNPEEAYPAPETIQLLKQLCINPAIQLAIISGRSIHQLRTFLEELVKHPIIFCGLHGGHIQQYPNNLTLCSPAPSIREHISQFKNQLVRALEAKSLRQLIFIEDKTFSLALHYRWTPLEKKETVIQCFESLYQQSDALPEMFRLQPGKEVIELVPSSFNKGACVQFLTHFWHEQDNLSPDKIAYSYIGDDLTDEHAFEAVRQLGGNAVLIGESSSSSLATMSLNSIDDLQKALQSISQCFQT